MIGIIGYGVIGKTTKLSLFPDEKIIIHDPVYNTKFEEILKCNLIFICIPTTDKKDLDNLKSLCIEISNKSSDIEFIIRSTVTPGFFKELQKSIQNPITYLPDFLRERFAIEDSINCETLFYASSVSETKLKQFERVNCKLKKIEFEELELLKMMKNNFNAMNVVFANHYYEISRKYGVDYDNLLKSFYEIKNDQTYLEVNENLRGYGGKCLPKDLDFMIEEFGDNIDLFKSIKNDNSKLPITIRKD